MGTGSNSIISFDSTGVGSQPNTPEEIIKQKLKFMLSTQKGELPNNLDYGADLQHFVSNPLDEMLELGLTMAIKAEVNRFMPMVTVKEVVVDKSVAKGALKFTVYYELTAGSDYAVDIVI